MSTCAYKMQSDFIYLLKSWYSFVILLSASLCYCVNFLAPENTTIMSISDNSVRISFVKPGGNSDGIEFYSAYAFSDYPLVDSLMGMSPSCIANVTMNQTECTLTGLRAGAQYRVNARSYSKGAEYSDETITGPFSTGELRVYWLLWAGIWRSSNCYCFIPCRGIANDRLPHCKPNRRAGRASFCRSFVPFLYEMIRQTSFANTTLLSFNITNMLL